MMDVIFNIGTLFGTGSTEGKSNFQLLLLFNYIQYIIYYV